jgi:hypothetical protein
VEFYKGLFGHNESCLSSRENFWPAELKLTETDKAELIRPFDVEEIKEVIMDMKEHSAPGPNGFTSTFFKMFWNVIKGGL